MADFIPQIRVKIIWDKVPGGKVMESHHVAGHQERVNSFLMIEEPRDIINSEFKVTKTDMITVIYYS